MPTRAQILKVFPMSGVCAESTPEELQEYILDLVEGIPSEYRVVALTCVGVAVRTIAEAYGAEARRM